VIRRSRIYARNKVYALSKFLIALISCPIAIEKGFLKEAKK